MARKIIPLYMLALSLLSGNDLILVKLENGEELRGVFIGTYMDLSLINNSEPTRLGLISNEDFC